MTSRDHELEMVQSSSTVDSMVILQNTDAMRDMN